MRISFFFSRMCQQTALWKRRSALLLLTCCCLLMMSACGYVQAMGSGATPTPTVKAIPTPTVKAIPTPTVKTTPTPTVKTTPTPSPTPSPTSSIARYKAQNVSSVVSFTPDTSYASALRLVTDLGLQLYMPCMQALTDGQGNVIGGMSWQPIGRKEFFTTTTGVATSGTVGKTPTVTVTTNLPSLFVFTTAITPADWLARLQASSIVHDINMKAMFGCPVMTSGTNRILSIAPKAAGTYVQVTFAATGVSYDGALYTVSNLGFRLADPAYERETGKPADWHPMGQQQVFATTHTLTLATTVMSPSNWRTQIAHATGVTKIVTPVN